MGSIEKVNSLLRAIPAVGKILELAQSKQIIDRFGEGMFKLYLVQEIEALRESILAGEKIEYHQNLFLEKVERNLSSVMEPKRREVVNATGILLHTGLGRAPLAVSAQHAVSFASFYTPVQSDLLTGKRSLRETKVEQLFKELTGAEAVTVVNNNAAATMLVLNTLAEDKKVVISRGQLVEIGGAFRMPDVMQMSRAIMSEIGTTNRTHLKDYRAAAADEEAAVLMHVHTSNYRLRGFGGTPSIAEITELAGELGLYAVDDLGSGALMSLARWGIEDEPLIKDSISAGVDLCCFSGDKLIGGPQSGIICGKRELVDKVRQNPFARMFRVDKLTLAGLEATLAIWVNKRQCEEIPLYMMLATSKDELEEKALILYEKVKNCIGGKVQLVKSEAYIGSGSLPDCGVESRAVVIEPLTLEAEKVANLLRQYGVFSRVNSGRVWIDVIAMLGESFELALCRIIEAFSSGKI